jgi:hypothetical protein
VFSLFALNWMGRSRNPKFFGCEVAPLICESGISGKGGLGVFVRAGLVKPVSLVKSAVDATLILLAMERRRL